MRSLKERGVSVKTVTLSFVVLVKALEALCHYVLLYAVLPCYLHYLLFYSRRGAYNAISPLAGKIFFQQQKASGFYFGCLELPYVLTTYSICRPYSFDGRSEHMPIY